jgi:hypothetical protein
MSSTARIIKQYTILVESGRIELPSHACKARILPLNYDPDNN